MWSCLVLVLALAVSAALADVLRRTVEEPFMALGRRLGRARREIIAADADADAAPTRAGRRDTSPAAAASNA